MVCSLTDPEKIKEWISICFLMKRLDPMVGLQFTPTHLNIQIEHSSRRCMFEATFPREWFSTYDWKETTLFVSTDSLYTIFSLYSGEKMISMESEKKYLKIQCFHEQQNKHFSIPLHYTPSSNTCIPPEKGVEFKILPSYFHTLCKELSLFDQVVLFHVKPEYFHMISHRDEKMVIEVQPSMIEYVEEGSYDNTFLLPYLLWFLKFAIDYRQMTVQLHRFIQFSITQDYTLHYYVCSFKS